MSPTAGTADVRELLTAFRSLRAVIVGDLVLDEWLTGTPTRLCREGPVPVVDLHETHGAPGQAGNTAANAAGLGANTSCVGIVGADENGRQLLRLLADANVDVSPITVDAAGATPSKRRLVSGDQVLARFDTPGGEWSTEARTEMEDRALDLMRSADVVIVSDYEGELTPGFRRRLSMVRENFPGILLVDAHRLQEWTKCRPTAVTPSASEALDLLGVARPPAGDAVRLLTERSASLLQLAGAEIVVTTADSAGCLVHHRGAPVHRTTPRPVTGRRAVCGAGDTFAAAFALGVASGASPEDAADLAQLAADVVLGQPGTSRCTASDILAHHAATGAGVVSRADAGAIVTARRHDGDRVVLTNGCFDLLHAGHVAYLQEARELGDLLVVGVNSDASVRRLKGEDRPIVPEVERARIVAALKPVDVVVIFDEDDATALVEQLRPDTYVKGGDYLPQMLPEASVVERLGGEVVLVDYVPDRSSSAMLRQIQQGVS